MRHYISIEKNTEGFETFKNLWKGLGIVGIRADSMSEGIRKVIEVEKSNTDEIYFISIVADEIDFMPQINILSMETDAPILIATSNYSDTEHHEALNSGTDFYGKYCGRLEQNVHAVVSVINSFDRRARKRRPPSKIIIYKDLLISPLQRTVFVADRKVELTRQEFDLLHYLMVNCGIALSFNQIYRRVWGGDQKETGREVLRNAIKRLREKLKPDPNCTEYIENVRDYGYRFPC